MHDSDEVVWAAGECHTWNVGWDQRFPDGTGPAPGELISFHVDWNNVSNVFGQGACDEQAVLR